MVAYEAWIELSKWKWKNVLQLKGVAYVKTTVGKDTAVFQELKDQYDQAVCSQEQNEKRWGWQDGQGADRDDPSFPY